jgi:hypothetical protein
MGSTSEPQRGMETSKGSASGGWVLEVFSSAWPLVPSAQFSIHIFIILVKNNLGLHAKNYNILIKCHDKTSRLTVMTKDHDKRSRAEIPSKGKGGASQTI